MASMTSTDSKHKGNFKTKEVFHNSKAVHNKVIIQEHGTHQTVANSMVVIIKSSIVTPIPFSV